MKMLLRKEFALMLLVLCGAFGVETSVDEVKTVSVMDGVSVALHTGLSEIKQHMQILWLFGSENPDILVAEIYKLNYSILESLEGLKEKVQLDQQTGSITIRNITIKHSGLYTAQIMSGGTIFRRFNVTVYSPVPLPVIESSSPVGECQIPVCAVLCSSENGPGVTLSWFKGRERLDQTSSPDLNVNLSLPLEIKDRNNDDVYYCVAANPVSNKTTQISFQEHCPQHADFTHFCGFTEVVIRLVVSALVGVAAVAMLVYDVRSERGVDNSLQMSP